MFLATDTDWAPWTVVKSNDEKRASLWDHCLIVCASLRTECQSTTALGRSQSGHWGSALKGYISASPYSGGLRGAAGRPACSCASFRHRCRLH
jgi:hypothetical protein